MGTNLRVVASREVQREAEIEAQAQRRIEEAVARLRAEAAPVRPIFANRETTDKSQLSLGYEE